MPWIVPEEFYTYFPAWSDIALAADPYAPVGMPDVAWHYPADVKGFDIPFNGTCNKTLSKLFRRAYYAGVAYQVSYHSNEIVLSYLVSF